MVDRDRAVVPREVVYPPGETEEQVDRETAEQMRRSQSSAVSAAARQLGFRTAVVIVDGVAAGAPADGRLRKGDVLRTADGRGAARRRRPACRGRPRPSRGGSCASATSAAARAGVVELPTAVSDDDGEPRPVIGVVTQEQPVNAPFDVTITLAEVGGPSAGLMFTLGILDKLGEPSLTGGRYIAGTGEISPSRRGRPDRRHLAEAVAAKAKGADAFLVPQGNCAEAVADAPAGLPLVEVAR